MRLEDYMQKNICTPLGITDMTFKLQQRPDMTARRADMSTRDGNGIPQYEDVNYYHQDSVDCFGGMGIFASPEAFMTFIHSLLRDDGKLLRSETVELLFQPALTSESEKVTNEQIDARQEINLGGLLPLIIKRNHALGGLLIMEDCHGKTWRQQGSMSWGGLPNLYWVSTNTV